MQISRFPRCVIKALSWNTNENPSTDMLSRAINYRYTSRFLLALSWNTQFFSYMFYIGEWAHNLIKPNPKEPPDTKT